MDSSLDRASSYYNILEVNPNFPTGNVDSDTRDLLTGIKEASERGTALKLPTNGLIGRIGNPIKFNKPLFLNGCGLVGLDSVATNGDNSKAPTLQYVGHTQNLPENAWISMTNGSWISGITLLGKKREVANNIKHKGIALTREISISEDMKKNIPGIEETVKSFMKDKSDSGIHISNVSIRDIHEGIVSYGSTTEPGRITIENCYIFCFGSGRGITLGTNKSSSKDYCIISNTHCRNDNIEGVGFTFGHIDGLMVSNSTAFNCHIGIECLESPGGANRDINGPSPSFSNVKLDRCDFGFLISGRTNAKISSCEVQALHHGIIVGLFKGQSSFNLLDKNLASPAEVGPETPSNVLITSSKIQGNGQALRIVKAGSISVTGCHLITNLPRENKPVAELYHFNSMAMTGNNIEANNSANNVLVIHKQSGETTHPWKLSSFEVKRYDPGDYEDRRHFNPAYRVQERDRNLFSMLNPVYRPPEEKLKQD